VKRLGTPPQGKLFAFWKDLFAEFEWVEAPLPELLSSGVQGIFLDPADSENSLAHFKILPRMVLESRFVDFVEVKEKKIFPRSLLRENGLEFFSLGTKNMNIQQRAYIAGCGAWARVFAMMASSKGYQSIVVITEQPAESAEMIQQLSHLCFGTKFEALGHRDLNLQPNNGSLLVNTLAPELAPEICADLSYLNYLSPSGLVIETHDWHSPHDLIVESKASGRPLIDANSTQGFAEYRGLLLQGRPLALTFAEYLAKRLAHLSQTTVPDLGPASTKPS